MKIPLHSNIRWGTAYNMLAQAYILRQASLTVINFISHFNVFDSQPIAIFLTSADEMYGPITTLRRNNRVVKHIPWSAFKMTDNDWNRVIDARDILGVCNSQPLFFI